MVINKKNNDWYLDKPKISMSKMIENLVKNPKGLFRESKFRYPKIISQSDEFMELIRNNFAESNQKFSLDIGVDLRRYGYFLQ